MSLLTRIREASGVALYDWLRFKKALNRPSSDVNGWNSICNRMEHLTPNPAGPGVRCDWRWGNHIHACRVFPSLGRQLLHSALREWPIRFAKTPTPCRGPRISFLFAHSGRDRIKQLRRVIDSVFAQRDIDVECIVVGQSPSPVQGLLPNEVVYRHLDKSHLKRGWYKSWAYNVGARIASGEILVFQDGDICMPDRYGTEVARAILQNGYDVASLQRFLFYLSPQSSARLESANSIDGRIAPDLVYQNWKGGTIAVRRQAFFDLGGFDEGFVDWGGEDDEFYDRCSAVRHCRFGYLPFVHLWHKPQPDRRATNNPNIATAMPSRMQMPAPSRIEELAIRKFGFPGQPDPIHSYKSTLTRSSPGVGE